MFFALQGFTKEFMELKIDGQESGVEYLGNQFMAVSCFKVIGWLGGKVVGRLGGWVVRW